VTTDKCEKHTGELPEDTYAVSEDFEENNVSNAGAYFLPSIIGQKAYQYFKYN